jgi:plastocyanin
MRRVFAIVILVAVAAALALGAVPAEASDKSVSIVGVNQGYSPGSVTVDPGDTVTWTDRDPTPAPHNAICDESCPEPFSSGDPGATGTTGHYRFRYSGTYNYNCAVHPNMKGAVVVTGNVHPPAGAAEGGPTSTASAAAVGSGRSSAASGSGSGSGSANSGASASATASSPGTPSASASGSGSDTGAGDAAKTPLPPVGQLALPQPQVRVHQASSSGTPWWVLLPSSLLLVIAAGICALAWLAPRPLRLRRAT